MSKQRKGNLKCEDENIKKLYHDINEISKIYTAKKEKVKDLSEKKKMQSEKKSRRAAFLFKRKKDNTDNMTTVISTEDEIDVSKQVDKAIEKFFFKELGFKNIARALENDTGPDMANTLTAKEIYIVAYNSNLLLLKNLFTSLEEKLLEIDTEKEYGEYCKNPIFSLAKTFVERIETDCLDQYEGMNVQTYCEKLLLYSEDLNKEISKIIESEEAQNA